MLFPIHKDLVDFKFREIEAFIGHGRDGMAVTWKEFSDDFDKTTAGWTDDAIAEYVDHVYDDIAMLRDESPQLLRHAHAMMVYGTFEHAVATLCRTVHRDGKIASAPAKDIYMHTAVGYLRPHLRVRHDPFAKEWGWMDQFRIIRNWMAHNGGRVQKDSTVGGKWDRAKQFLVRNRGMISFASLGDILVEDTLIDRALDRAGTAIDRLHRAVGTLYR